MQAVLKEYLRLDKEITEKAKDLLQKRNLPYEQFGKVKRALAGEKGFGLGDEALDWMTNQMIESFMQSPHVEEVFVEDGVLRKQDGRHPEAAHDGRGRAGRRGPPADQEPGRGHLDLGRRVPEGARADQAEPRPGVTRRRSGVRLALAGSGAAACRRSGRAARRRAGG